MESEQGQRPKNLVRLAFTWSLDATEALRTWAGKHRHRLMNLYGHDEPGTIATLGGHELRAKLVPARDLDHATVELRIEGIPRATTQIARRSLLAADIGTIRQLESRVSSLHRLAADVEERRQEALAHVEQADKALAEPCKHADAFKAAQTDSARINQLMAAAAKPKEPAKPEEPAGEVDPRLEKMQRPMNSTGIRLRALTSLHFTYKEAPCSRNAVRGFVV